MVSAAAPSSSSRPTASPPRPVHSSDLTKSLRRTIRQRRHGAATQVHGTVDKQLRSMAGPQLHPQAMQPWRAPGGTLYRDTEAGQVTAEPVTAPPGWNEAEARVLWRNAGAGPMYTIPVPFTPNRTPSASCTDQRELHAFLRNLNRAGLETGKEPATKVRVLEREVSARDAKSRTAEFGDKHNRKTAPSGKIEEEMIGDMPLSEYSMTAETAGKREILMKPGTVMLVASRNTIIKKGEQVGIGTSQMDTSLARAFLRRVHAPVRGHLTQEQQDELAAAEAEPVWHNCAVAVIDFDDGTASSKRVYVYDPAYPNASMAAGEETTRPEETRRKGNSCRASEQRAKWMRAASKSDSNIYIGGGGNFHGLDECRPMSLNFMQQFWTLATHLQLAKERAVSAGMMHRDDEEWKQAHQRLKHCFLHNFEPVRLSGS